MATNQHVGFTPKVAIVDDSMSTDLTQRNMPLTAYQQHLFGFEMGHLLFHQRLTAQTDQFERDEITAESARRPVT